MSSASARTLIPGGTQTFSKADSQFPTNAPRYFVRGEGAHVLGSDDVWYIDYTMGLGAISLGYRHPEWCAAVHDALYGGTIFGRPHPIEQEFAEELVPLLPWPDAMVRYGKNGSDATGGAVRAARAITGRDLIASRGYHGWLDWCCPNETGIPIAIRGLTHMVNTDGSPPAYACAIVEPDGVADLAALRSACDETDALLIFDEVLTGFRTPQYTYASWKGVTPDLICLAKAIANGAPLAVIAGPEKYMRVFAGDIGYSFTFGGEVTALAAGLATVRKYKREPVVEHMWQYGARIQDAWNAKVKSLGLDMPLVGDPSRTVVRYPSLEMRTLLSQEFFRRHISWTVGATICYAHSQADLDVTLEAIEEVLDIAASVKDDPAKLVEGRIVSHPYRKMTA